MEIERTTFGTITIDGKTYEHDVIIRLSGEVAMRKKKLSKKHYGTSHVLSKDEAKFVFENGCEQLILGSGQLGGGERSRSSRQLSRFWLHHGRRSRYQPDSQCCPSIDLVHRFSPDVTQQAAAEAARAFRVM